MLSSSPLTWRLFLLFCISQFSLPPDARFFFFFASSVIHHASMFLNSWFLLDRVTRLLSKFNTVRHVTGGGRTETSRSRLLPSQACLLAPRLLHFLDLESLPVGPMITHRKHLSSRQDYVKIKSSDSARWCQVQIQGSSPYLLVILAKTVSLNLSFLICKIRLIILPTSQGVVRIKITYIKHSGQCLPQ